MSKDYYIFKNGTLKRKDNTLCFIEASGEKRIIPIEQVNCIHIFGEVDVNSKLLSYMPEFGITINFYNYYGYYAGAFVPRKTSISGYVVVKQSLNFLDYEKRLYLAKCFIESAVHHILRNLRKYKDQDGIFKIIESIEIEKVKIKEVCKIDELMGIEGRIRKCYYSAFNSFLSEPFMFSKREKRPPTDPLNALISFGNSLMYTAVLSEIYKTQLDPSVSFLHEPTTKRFSLSLDIAEIFKPLIIDHILFHIINNRMITLDHFDQMEGICYLNDEGKKIFLKAYEEKMETTIKHRVLNRKVSYRTFIRLECYKLIKHLIGDEVYKPLKAWW